MTIQVMTLVESKAREEKAAELEVWRQAYNAAITAYPSEIACRVANKALSDYRAKREELLK